MKTLFLALGNPIVSDDAVGWEVADRLAALPVAEDADFLKESGATLDLIGQLAETYMLVGEFDAAIDQLAIGLGMPSFMSVPLLRVWPEYKPLANVPRFQSLLAEYQHDGDKE